MLGFYKNFPRITHCVATFTYNLSSRKIQQAMILTFHQLNKEVYRLHDVIRFAPSSECETSFEFGVAEGAVFNYLDKEEVNRLQKSVAKKAMSIIDFLCVVRYHRVNKEKRVPLRFDYHLLRFMFNKNNGQLQIFHERGTQRISLEELVKFVTDRIKERVLSLQRGSLDLNPSKSNASRTHLISVD